MARTTERVLQLLGLLQQRPVWSGPELAERLGVTTRCIRRDVTRLRELGYPVHAAHGAAGGYQLGRGRTLPPLLLDDAEAVAVAVALAQTAGGSVAGAGEGAVGALGKLDQVLPPRLRAQVRAISEATSVHPVAARIDADDLLALARACRERLRVRFGYTARDGTESDREVEPIRLVDLSGYWYLMAFDRDRDDWRTFRLDRVGAIRVTTWQFPPRDHPDPLEWVRHSVAESPYPQQIRVILDCSAERGAALVPPRAGTITPIDDGHCELVLGRLDLGWEAMHLVALGVGFRVIDPPELVHELRRLAARMLEAAERS
ncbi:helix-turn-helix transcriptional regulator [Naumannella huperziae]